MAPTKKYNGCQAVLIENGRKSGKRRTREIAKCTRELCAKLEFWVPTNVARPTDDKSVKNKLMANEMRFLVVRNLFKRFAANGDRALASGVGKWLLKFPTTRLIALRFDDIGESECFCWSFALLIEMNMNGKKCEDLNRNISWAYIWADCCVALFCGFGSLKKGQTSIIRMAAKISFHFVTSAKRLNGRWKKGFSGTDDSTQLI